MTQLTSSSEHAVITKGVVSSCSQPQTWLRKLVYPPRGRAWLGGSSLRTKAEGNLHSLQPPPGPDTPLFMNLRGISGDPQNSLTALILNVFLYHSLFYFRRLIRKKVIKVLPG